MKITAYEISDFKRIESVRIEPGERSLVVIGGKNGAGKSSILDGLTAAFGGKRETDPKPVRDGAPFAEIKVELDDGALVIRRRIQEDGKQTVEIYDDSGKKRAPQRMLDDLVGARFLDPLRFMRMTPSDQREALISCIEWPDGFSYGQWLAEYEQAYEERRDANREAKRLHAANDVAQKRRPTAIPEAHDIGELADDLDAETERYNAGKALIDESMRAVVALRRIRATVLEKRDELDQLERDLKAARKFAKEKISKEPPDGSLEATQRNIDSIRNLMSSASESMQARTDALAAQSAADDAASAATEASTKANILDAKIEEMRHDYAAQFAAAKTPVEGIELDDGQVLLGGVPFQQASDAERLRAALAIAMAMSPSIRDVWVKDGSLLDLDSLDLVRTVAEEHDCRVWIERVGESDDDAIIIRDGAVVGGDGE